MKTQLEINTEIASRTVRNDRNYLLSQSDWTQAIDSPLGNEKKSEWLSYRESLRNLTNQEGFPWNIVWPTKPE